MNLSKTRYCDFLKCPKRCWLAVHKPDVSEVDGAAEQRIVEGHRVGEIAKGLFGEFHDVTTQKEGGLDYTKMIEKTQALVRASAETICEAAFSYNGCYCAVDVLHRERGGYAIYEVKSSSSEKSSYVYDIAYQKYVLENCGINITGTYLVYVNNQYVFHGEIDVGQFFQKVDYAQKVAGHSPLIAANCERAKSVLDCADAPTVDLTKNCDGCEFWAYCAKELPRPCVLDLGGNFGKWERFQEGIVTFEDVRKSGMKLSAKQEMQIDYALHEKGTYVDKKAIRKFLDGLTYPLYFLDFETMQPVIPQIEGTRPYQRIPFQYSLHFVECENGEVGHTEFLGEPETDPRRALAEQLCKDIPRDACTLAYSASVERGIINDLAKEYADLSDYLKDIAKNIKDLEEPFSKRYYYNRAMEKRSSIKAVLPAVFPNNSELNYHNLEGVQNGTEAMNIFPQMKDMLPEERARARQNLLKYCGLDTYAMVKLWQELVRVCK